MNIFTKEDIDYIYDIRKMLNDAQDLDIKNSISMVFHEIEREINYTDQQLRIYEHLKTKHENNHT